jgi:hypothetical protein
MNFPFDKPCDLGVKNTQTEAAVFYPDRRVTMRPAEIDISFYLAYLQNRWVLIGLGLLFLLMLKLHKEIFASGILGLVGYYHAFQLLPERTGHAVRDMRALFDMMGSTEVLVFLGGVILVSALIVCLLLRSH